MADPVSVRVGVPPVGVGVADGVTVGDADGVAEGVIDAAADQKLMLSLMPLVRCCLRLGCC